MKRQIMKQAVKHQAYRYFLVGLAAILLVGMTSLAGCSVPPTDLPRSIQTTQVLPAVPQRANLIGRVEVAEVIDDEEFAEFYRVMAAQDATLPPTLDAALDKVERGIGIKLRDFNYVIAFADASSLLDNMESPQRSSGFPYCGALVQGKQGKLDERTFIHSVESKIGRELAKSNYQGFTVYTLTGSHSQDKAFGVAFLADGQMVIGTTHAVEDVIDVIVGLQEPIRGTVYELYSQLSDAFIRLASSIPESFTGRIPAEAPVGPINLSLLSFRDIKYTTLTVTKKEAIIDADVHFEFTNEDSAKESGRLLWIAATAGRYVMPDPDAKELLSKVETARSGSSVSITLTIPMSELERLASAAFERLSSSLPFRSLLLRMAAAYSK